MIYTEVLPYIFITDIKYVKRTKITNGTILLLSNISASFNESVNVIRLPLEFTGKHHEYKENIEKNKKMIASNLISLINVILEIHKKPNRENLYITCPDGTQIAPFIFLVYLVHYGKMAKEEALSCIVSKNTNFFSNGVIYYDILK